MKLGETIELPYRARDINFNKIGGLKAEIISIDKNIATIKILATGTITKIYI